MKNMRDGWYMNDTGERVIHKMQTELGVQKGIRTMLVERKKFLKVKVFHKIFCVLIVKQTLRRQRELRRLQWDSSMRDVVLDIHYDKSQIS